MVYLSSVVANGYRRAERQQDCHVLGVSGSHGSFEGVQELESDPSECFVRHWSSSGTRSGSRSLPFGDVIHGVVKCQRLKTESKLCSVQREEPRNPQDISRSTCSL